MTKWNITGALSAIILIIGFNSIASAEEEPCGMCIQALACAVSDTGELKTFSTPCVAIGEGYKVLYLGYCEEEGTVCPRRGKKICAISPGSDIPSLQNECLVEKLGLPKLKRAACRKKKLIR